MKNLIVSIGTCLLSCVLFSCSENVVLDEVDNTAGNLQTRSMIDAPYYVQGDGTLCFRSVEDYFSVTDSLVRLTDSEFNNWEKSIGFESYKSYVDGLIDEIEEAFNDDNYDKANSLLNDYSKYIYLDNDSIIQPVISSNTYRHITNKDGVFYLGDLQNIVNDKYIYAVSKERTVSSMVPYILTNNARSEEEAIRYERYSYIKEDDTKMVISSPSILRNVVLTDVQGANISQIQLELFVDGKRHKRGWKHYSTGYSVKEILCRFKSIPLSIKNDGTLKSSGDFTFSHPAENNSGSSESKYHAFTYNIGVAVKNYTYPIQHAVCIHYKATTWGTAPEGIGYNYSNNKYGIDTEHKKENCASKVCDIHSNIHCGK